MKALTPRDLALKVLSARNRSPGFTERRLKKAFEQNPYIDERDRAFATNLVQGVLRWRLRIDRSIEKASSLPFKKINPQIINILRIAIYQIFFLDRLPESAAVNEAVKQAKRKFPDHVAGFVNGILRNICRRKDQPVFPDPKKDKVSYLSIYYSYPPWLIKKWIREIGGDSTQSLLSAGNKIPELVIRLNSMKIDRDSLLKRLKEEGVGSEPTTFSPEGIIINSLKGPVNRLKTCQDGLFQVQSEPAQVCSYLISPAPGEKILDLCSGLGGKSTHLAQLMRGRGTVFALDINHTRLIKLNENSRRLGICNIQPVVADACSHLSSLFRQPFDKILVDGPCSALGTISRHPDGKWCRDGNDIKRLSGLQKKILNQGTPLLKKGGYLLYMTCTISKDENEDVVKYYLETNKEMVLENLGDHVPDWGHDLIDDSGFFKSLPHIHGIDGFFGALFRKL
ncbi:MAG: 16S rRNA (cytosine(967)-C(5))-methyltransferase [Desulfobacteraceae bacterium 4484_190.1]|nr:MAG: 16S rRNA (cytosine(967)-C(5))-methyltransferase [Desulfobacteraceae bacterium 4484_190.1]